MIVCWDSNIAIYFVERNPVWNPKVTARFKVMATAGDTMAASDLALSECLIGPMITGDMGVMAEYQ